MSGSNDQDPFIGHLLADKYQIVKRVGHGGMGAVYQGSHVLMDRKVAVKIIHTRLAEADPARLSRFHLEAKAASCLSHNNIITVFDFGITRTGLAYLVMDYITGEGLDAVFRRDRTLSVPRVVEVFSQVCEALAHAHDKGIVHRDLKPGNIMLSAEAGKEIVKVVDFGIAKFLDGSTRGLNYSPRDSQVVGSPLYMSPEQCMGDKNLDGRSDIYSLGCLLYQALTGRPPFAEETVLSIIYAHLNTTPAPFATAAPDEKIPPEMEAVVFKALSKNPHSRQKNMRELEQELQAAARSLETAPQAASEPEVLLKKLADIEAGSPQLVPHLHDLADFYRNNRQPDQAEAHLREALHCMVDAYGAWDMRVAEAVKKLADFYRSCWRYHEAEPLYHDLLLIKQKALGEQHPDIPCILLRLADIYFKNGRNKKALRYYMRCLRISEQLFGPNDSALTPILTGLGSTLRRLSQDDEAEVVYKRALKLEEQNLGADHYEVASTLVGLGVVYRFRSKFLESETALRRALDIYEQTVGSNHHNVGSVLLLLAELYSVQGYDGAAQDLYDRAIKIRESDRSNHMDIEAAFEMWAAHYLSRQEGVSSESAFKKVLVKDVDHTPAKVDTIKP